MDYTTNQYLEVGNYGMNNEIHNLPLINHGQRANNINKKRAPTDKDAEAGITRT